MLYCFDLDGTLITGYMDNPDKDYHTWSVLPGRVEKLRQLQAEGHAIAIVTNQGAVAFGYVKEWEMWSKIRRALHACGIYSNSAYVCFHDIRGNAPYNRSNEAARRKPSGVMIREAMHEYDVSPSECVMVGDRPEDEAAAHDAGVAFVLADEFFGA